MDRKQKRQKSMNEAKPNFRVENDVYLVLTKKWKWTGRRGRRGGGEDAHTEAGARTKNPGR